MEATEERLLALCAVAIAHDARPDASRRAELCHLFEDVGPRGEEEGESRRDGIHLEAACDRCIDVGDRVGKRKGELLRGGRPRLAHVIARDADRVPLRQLGGTPLEDVGDQPQRWLGREDVRTAGDVLLEEIVLCRTRELGA